MKFPPARIGQNERQLSGHEISALSCTGMARKTVEDIAMLAGSGWTVDMSGETVSHDDEFGYVYRFRVTSAFKESGKNYNHEFIYVLWSKDCKSMGIASFPALELKLPQSPKRL
jgi:hypothetical protein